MSSLKQVIYNALMKVATPAEGGEQIQYDSAEAARDDFIAKVMAELFPEEEQLVEVPKAKKSPKKSPEEKAAEKEAKAKAKEEAKAAKAAEKEAKAAEKEAKKKAKEEAKVAKVVQVHPAHEDVALDAVVKSPKKSPEEKAAAKAEAKAAKEAAKAAEKEAKAKAKEEAKAAEKAAKAEAKAAEKVAKAEAKAESPKKPRKTKADPDANLPKIDPTWRKALKEADKEHAKELEPELLTYVNLLSNVVFNDKGVKEHIADFLAQRAKPAPVQESVEVDLEVVEFNGKEYYVNPETKRVYEGELDGEGNLKVTRPVGYVGMADFKDMVL